MKRKFEKPVSEKICFSTDVIVTSEPGCYVLGEWIAGGCNENVCISINTYCDCQTNTTDPTARNCICRTNN